MVKFLAPKQLTKMMATTVETQPQNNATGMGANVPNVSQDATQQDPIMAKSDEQRESKQPILKLVVI